MTEMEGRLPTTPEAWAFALAEASNAAMKARATADIEMFLPAVQAIRRQAIGEQYRCASREAVVQMIEDALRESDSNRNTYRDQAEVIYSDLAHLLNATRESSHKEE